MAGEKDAVIELAEEGVVTVDIGGDPDLAAAADELADEVVTAKEKPAVVQQRTSKPSAADEAAAVLTQSLRTAEEGRKAAEATALAERQRAETAQRTLAAREAENSELQQTASEARLASLTSGIETATREVETLTAELERAGEAGDFKAQAVANAKLAQVAARKDRLEADRAAFETAPKKPSTEGRVVAVPAVPAFDKYVANFAPRAQTWLRAHSECVPAEYGGNATKNSTMMAGHFEALAKGIQEGSDAYFQHLEEKTGYRDPVSTAGEVTLAGDKPVQQQRTVPQVTQRRPQPAAPPSRDSEATGGNARSVRLTPQQQEAAMFSATIRAGETEDAFKARALGSYARELVRAQAEGKIGRLTH